MDTGSQINHLHLIDFTCYQAECIVTVHSTFKSNLTLDSRCWILFTLQSSNAHWNNSLHLVKLFLMHMNLFHPNQFP